MRGAPSNSPARVARVAEGLRRGDARRRDGAPPRRDGADASHGGLRIPSSAAHYQERHQPARSSSSEVGTVACSPAWMRLPTDLRRWSFEASSSSCLRRMVLDSMDAEAL